ncbi:MAG: hypothetical protein ACYTXC_27285 [Nostoc sp.]
MRVSSNPNSVYRSAVQFRVEVSFYPGALLITEHMLLSVAAKYGKNSDEYKMAGGVRRSDRKRPVRKLKQEAVA